MVTMNANTSVTGSFVTLGPAPGPDLRVAAVSEPPGSAVRGARFAVTDTVVNAGNASAGSSRTRYYLSVAGTRAAGDILLSSSRLVQTLTAGAQSQGTVTVIVPSNTPFGTYRLLACADDTFVIAETDEADNCVASVGSIVIGLPDLVISALTSPPPSARRGAAVTLTDTVTNNGTAPAAASTTRYYVSLDAVRNTGDRLMTGTRSVGTLAPGARSTGTVNVVIPSTLTPGTYYVMACADDLLRVIESGGNNNCRAAPTRISVTP
jgi:subtilase family serine protease